MGYLLNTETQVKEMLGTLGLKSLDDLYGYLPKELFIGELNIPSKVGEIDIGRQFDAFAGKNKAFHTMFRGAGAYRHYIPAVVPAMASKERFKTTYTAYQAEVSQGILQAIYEYQTMICELTGMDVSNASIYDGGSATAEAISMTRGRKRNKALISEGLNPRVRRVVETYNWATHTPIEGLPQGSDGLVDLAAFAKAATDDVATIVIQQPNYFGLIEDVSSIVKIAHDKGIKVIVNMNPTAGAILATPGECGADIAVGEGQPLGIPLSFGGPYLGFLATKTDMLRTIPGRIIGETTDDKGNRAFVHVLQAREQHIRRETARSNICSNQALILLQAAVYLASMGEHGLTEVATRCLEHAHYLARELDKIGFKRRHDREFFHEFVTESPVCTDKLMIHLENHGILGGLPVEGNGILWCATELNTKAEMDHLVQLCQEVPTG